MNFTTRDLVLIGFGVLVIALVLGVIRWALRRRGKEDPDAGLDDELAGLPAAPPPGTHRLTFEGLPVRLRLVVIAPTGRSVELSASMAEGLLQAVVHGMGEVADLDEPRVRVWPGQLSHDGFAPKFFDNVTRPEAAGRMSRWILVAGPAKAGAKTILVGLALEAAEATTRGNVRLKAEQWNDKFQVRVQ